MLRGRHFKVDPGRVVHETIDGETIVIDLETGTYYSLRGSAPEVWALLVAGWSEQKVIAELQRRYADESETVPVATSALIDQLHEEGLLEECERNGQPLPKLPEAARPGEAFAAPVLERFTDMEYFLMLDPIHEVAGSGWPHVSAADPPQTAT
jgi:hypothetical protein